MKWECTGNSRSLDQIYQVFKEIIEIKAELCFMTSFQHDGITYIASPLNIDSYPDEILNSDEQKFNLWKLDE